MAAHSLGQVEAYFTVREVLAEESTVVPPKAGLWREHSAFGRWRFATLGFKYRSGLAITPVGPPAHNSVARY